MKNFNPQDFGFVKIDKAYKSLNFYEYNSGGFCDGTIDPHRLNVYLTQDGDFVTVWHGLFDPAFVDQAFHDLIERTDREQFDLTANYHTQFFRGHIETKEQADVILASLRYEKMVPSVIYIHEDGYIACDALPSNAEQETSKAVDISKYIGSMSGTFGSVEEIDEYIRKERESWAE